MSPIDQLSRLEKRLSDLPSRLEGFVLDAADDQTSLMEDLVVQQMEQGIRGNETLIEPPYAQRTILEKKRKGQIYDHVTLSDTGAFHRAERATRKGDVFSIESSDEKNALLEKKYEPDIHDLTSSNIAKVSREILPDILESTKKFILS